MTDRAKAIAILAEKYGKDFTGNVRTEGVGAEVWDERTKRWHRPEEWLNTGANDLRLAYAAGEAFGCNVCIIRYHSEETVDSERFWVELINPNDLKRHWGAFADSRQQAILNALLKARGKMTPEQKSWIDNASYEDLLRKWRHAPAGDPMFVSGSEVTEYFQKAMSKKRETADTVAASKSVGW